MGTIPYDTPLLLQKLKKMGGAKRVRCCYEAGPTGYGLHPDLVASGYRCDVVAPSLVPKQVTEAMRDLERAREDAKPGPAATSAGSESRSLRMRRSSGC